MSVYTQIFEFPRNKYLLLYICCRISYLTRSLSRLNYRVTGMYRRPPLCYKTSIFEIKPCRPIYRLAVDKPMRFKTEKPYGDAFLTQRARHEKRHTAAAGRGERAGSSCDIISKNTTPSRKIPAHVRSREIFPGSRLGNELNFLI